MNKHAILSRWTITMLNLQFICNVYGLSPACFTAISLDIPLIPLKSKGGLPSRLKHG